MNVPNQLWSIGVSDCFKDWFLALYLYTYFKFFFWYELIHQAFGESNILAQRETKMDQKKKNTGLPTLGSLWKKRYSWSIHLHNSRLKRKDIKTTLEARFCWKRDSFWIKWCTLCWETPYGSIWQLPTLSFLVLMDQNLSGLVGCGGDSYYEVAPLVVREGNRKRDRPLLREQLQRTAAIFCVLWKAASVTANQMRRSWVAKAWLGEGQPGEEPGFCCNYYTFWPPSFQHGCWKSLQ